MEYKILSEMDEDTLEVEVNSAIADGWEPLGGLATVSGGDRVDMYLQAMIRRQPILKTDDDLARLFGLIWTARNVTTEGMAYTVKKAGE